MRGSHFVALVASVLLLPACSWAEDPPLRKVAVTHAGDDTLGKALAYSVIEKVRNADQFIAVEQNEADLIISLMTTPIDGGRSAYALTIDARYAESSLTLSLSRMMTAVSEASLESETDTVMFELEDVLPIYEAVKRKWTPSNCDDPG